MEQSELVIAAMGPVGHVYVNRPLSNDEREQLAKSLVDDARIPVVSITDGPDHVRIWTREGQLVLPEDAHRLFPPDHPFRDEIAQDFIALCQHPDAGDFVIWGWSGQGPLYTFPIENGSHAGPGLEETHAFALLPDDAPLYLDVRTYPRPLDLRAAALRHLGREVHPPEFGVRPITRRDTLRVMTYNVHSCVGIDGKLSPHRIARVIARYQPDIVALQEVDIGRLRTGQMDQAQIIARYLQMHYHFNPTIRVAEELYGDCILSSLPMRLKKTGTLPILAGRDSLEPRGALWVAIDLDGKEIEFVNTHLGLSARERLLQLRAILGEDWLGDHDRLGPVVFCGDFNTSPQSRAWKLCSQKFHDVQMEGSEQAPRRTWFGHYPIARIDHIFVSRQIEVVRVQVGDDYLARIASDHRPLFAEIRIKP